MSRVGGKRARAASALRPGSSLTAALLAASVGGAGGVLAPSVALAQGVFANAGGALDRFDPSLAGDTFFAVPSADVLGRLALSGSATFSYAHDPLFLHSTTSSEAVDWVSQQSLLYLQASLEVLARVKLDLALPVLLTEGGSSGSLEGVSVTAPSSAHAGDLRVAARAAVVHQDGYLPAVGVGLEVWAPTGSARAFAGGGTARVEPMLAISGEYRYLAVSAAAGARYQGAEPGSLVGSEITGGFGVAARVLSTGPRRLGGFDGLTLGPELTLAAPLGPASVSHLSSGAAAELLFAARYRWRALSVGLAGGPGLSGAVGSPAYRLLAGIGGSFDPLSTAKDEASKKGADADSGVAAGSVTAAPVGPPDKDGDGVPDAEDACPEVAGAKDADPKKNGCPPDKDGDGVPDAEDACAEVFGVKDADPKKNGCPRDSDGDGIPDDRDACPHEKGPANPDPTKNGCPTSVRVEGSQIVILQQVHFDSGKDSIQPVSFELLGEVAGALRDHPEIARLAVDGHTDNRGGDKPNKQLSERRALSVVRWLVEHGVDARRLEARGFGQRQPIADNATEPGRAKNRRVEFLILRRTELGEKGWLDGSVDDGEPPKPPGPPASRPR